MGMMGCERYIHIAWHVAARVGVVKTCIRIREVGRLPRKSLKERSVGAVDS